MRVVCPICDREIAAEQVNASTDLAFCTSCGQAFQLSEILETGESRAGDVNNPPPGVWFEPLFDGWRLGATMRSWAALFIVPFTAVWAGGSMAGIYGTQIVQGQFNWGISLFGIPFAIGSVVLVTVSLLSVFGRQIVSIQGDIGEIFTGIGIIGHRRRFSWNDVTRIREIESNRPQRSNSPQWAISLEGPESRTEFGSMLSKDRRFYMVRVLRRAIAERNKARAALPNSAPKPKRIVTIEMTGWIGSTCHAHGPAWA